MAGGPRTTRARRATTITAALAAVAGAAIVPTALGAGAQAAPCASTAFVNSAGETKLATVDVPTRAREADIPSPVNALANGLAITPDGKTAFSVHTGINEVMAIDVASRQIIGFIPTGNAPQDIAITPDGTTALVTNTGTDNVSVFDPRTFTTDVPIVLDDDSAPEGIAISPDGSVAFVANTGTDDVSVIDLATLTKQPTDIPVGIMPSSVAFTPDGSTALVTNRAGTLPDGPDLGGSVSFIDVATRTKEGADITGLLHPADVVVSNDGATAFVTSFSDDNVVYLLDVPGRADTGIELPVGNHPSDLAITHDGTEVWVSSLDGITLSVIDVAARTSEPDAIQVLGSPSGIAFTPCGGVPPTTTTTAAPTTVTTAPAPTPARPVAANPTFAG